MLKPLAVALLTVSAAVATAASAGNYSPPPPPNNEGFLCWILPWLCQPHPGHGGGVTSAPEIDVASAAAALTLLGGGLAVLRGRRSRRKDP